MSEILEAGDLQPFAIVAVVQIIDHIVAVSEPNKVEIKLVPHGFDQTEQVLIFLWLAIEITLFVNEPGDLRVRAETVAEFFGAESRGADEICPPMIVRLSFILLPLFQGRPANHDDPFTFRDVIARERF